VNPNLGLTSLSTACSTVSPSFIGVSTLHSFKKHARKATLSVVENFFPRQTRGPDENAGCSFGFAVAPSNPGQCDVEPRDEGEVHRYGLNLIGSGKWRGLWPAQVELKTSRILNKQTTYKPPRHPGRSCHLLSLQYPAFPGRDSKSRGTFRREHDHAGLVEPSSNPALQIETCQILRKLVSRRNAYGTISSPHRNKRGSGRVRRTDRTSLMIHIS
jgi:hypothetical protein